jgi:hypothetical protein
MIKKGIILALMLISLFVLSACDIYETLYVKQPIVQGDAIKVPEGNITKALSSRDSVYRAEKEQAEDPENLEKAAYAAALPIEHDPFKLGKNPLGPFKKGKSLGFTLGEWLAASGSGIYKVEDGNAELELSFENLIPDSVYTVWCSRLTFPPNPEIVDKPCGASDGSENEFKSDSEGNAEFNVELDPLEQSSEETATVIALAYHSDGKTYGELPGDFGLNTHVQIFYMVPVPDEEVPDSYELEFEFVNHIEAELPEQDVFIEIEEDKESMEENAVIDEKIIPEGATVIIVEETERVSLVPKAEDPDKDTLIFAFTSPLDSNGEWQTNYGDEGQYTVTVTASDGTLTASSEVLIIVNRKEEAPVLESSAPDSTSIEIDETEEAKFEVSASDLNNDEITYQWKLDGINVGKSKSYSYSTTYEDSGSHTIKITVSDGLFNTERIWSVTVNNKNRKPVLEELQDMGAKETEEILIEVGASDPDGDSLTYSISNERFEADGNIFRWKTTYEDSGEYVARVTVSDGVDQTAQEFGITIENVNRPPVILDIVQK